MSIDMKKIEELKKEFEARIERYEFLNTLEKQTGAPKLYIALGIVGFVLLFLLFGIGGAAVTSLIGFVYPCYASFKALKTSGKEDDEFWLTYWVVYAFFSVLETVSDFLFKYIPFYFLFKVVFLVWCFLPQTRGAKWIFDYGIEPILSKYEKHIDDALSRGTSAAGEFGDELSAAQAATTRAAVGVAVASLASSGEDRPKKQE
jgi:receptor expression-enhancing protein 5/6